MGYVGGIHFWWPKITGRLYPETLSRIAAVTLFVGFNLTFFRNSFLATSASAPLSQPIRRNFRCSMCCPPQALQYSRWVIFCR